VGPQCGAETAEHLIQEEQQAYLKKMEIPGGIAANLALRENVFVMFVCILNRIPCFCIGRPGSSKSLSLRILNASVRGEVRPHSVGSLWMQSLAWSGRTNPP